ncbi:MAG: hypothetical protein CMN90_14960 [Sutterellaceae bacterium]|nr:hypothetical protein [Sutterellaceae bacterium]
MALPQIKLTIKLTIRFTNRYTPHTFRVAVEIKAAYTGFTDWQLVSITADKPAQKEKDMKRLLALSALVGFTAAAGTAMASNVDVAVAIGMPAPVYATVQSHPQPIRVQEQHGQPYGQRAHAAQYRHEAPRHHKVASHGEGRHARYDDRRAHRESRSHDRGSSRYYDNH